MDLKRFFRSKDNSTIHKWHEERRVFINTMKVLQADTIAQWVPVCEAMGILRPDMTHTGDV
jgi:hypothetical protein